MHHLPSLFSKVSLQFRIVSNTVRMHGSEIFFSAVPNRFKYRHNACFRDIVLKNFSAIPNRFKYRQHACFRDIVFIFFFAAFQIISTTVFYSSFRQFKSFKTLSECMLKEHCFQNVLCCSKLF